MREEEANLELDLDGEGSGRVARVTVAEVEAYTRQGAPTITASCGSYAALHREVERLKEELDAILEAARTAFDGAQTGESAAATQKVSPEETRKPTLDVSLKVGEVMTRAVETVDRNDRISVADGLMKTGRFRHVVVLDNDRSVAGVVSHRDIVYGALAWTLGQGRGAHDKALESYSVKDVMATDVVTIDSDASLGNAAALMRERKLGCLPVVDGEELVGILTEGDFLYLLAG